MIYTMTVDFQLLHKQCSVGDFFVALEVAPHEALSCLGAAAYEVLFCTNKQVATPGKINIRLHNHPDSLLALKSLKASCLGKLVSVRGTVVRMSVVKPLVKGMDFTCSKCTGVITRQFKSGRFSPPSSCSANCRSKTFTPERATAKLMDFQKIRLQEISNLDGHEEGRLPRTVECELTEDLVNACIPGDIVTVCGIVEIINPSTDVGSGGGKSKGKQSLYHLYLEAVSITNTKSQQTEVDEPEKSNVNLAAPSNASGFSPVDLELVANFVDEAGPDLFRWILHSICPSIYGHELVKAGIALALFGGVRKHVMDKNKVPVRGDIHVIIVGDPGLGKSQLLQAASALAPRGIYVCGNTTTTAGLTVAVVKDALSGDYVFEAGAVVLADQGICCIDEFDKMSADHQALLEAMEQQSVSVAKAGLVASLSARTSILAAANPVGGHYNRAKTVNENLKMSAAILSRFDLVFILLDKPNEALDQHLSEHIMALHAGSKRRRSAAKKSLMRQVNGDLQEMVGKDAPLARRLKLDPVKDKGFRPVPAQFLRQYVAYAKLYVSPQMTKEAADVLQQFYLQLRKQSSADGSPITARQLESLVRLVEARARLELREEIIKQDALDVVEIMKESLFDKLTDENGHVDFGRSGGMSQQKEAKRFLSFLQRKSAAEEKSLFTIAELFSIADEICLQVPDMDMLIEKLNDAGHLLKKGGRQYQVQSSSYAGSQRYSQSRH
ncbi:hypothetical protein BDL97_16G036800 [Sphagnum fallax]|nr:hypothetical protein BDL97_16G036800 [Sphagnum fallax]KAH8937601.1 hypothetical protein BDL97_16G036800 [Sphagnum fallax]